ncbi:MAG: N-6 DNA methylase, partial [Bifidobacteriaceae bacterium]|nr:N-6 DNA methylase [Bifidobacteriaceae bacterium]
MEDRTNEAGNDGEARGSVLQDATTGRVAEKRARASRGQRIAEFVDRWKGHGDEKQETQRFWIDLMGSVLDIANPTSKVEFERRTSNGGFIDALFPDARFLVEQKSYGVDLDKPEPRQGKMVTPVQQALRYSDNMPASEKPRALCTCNFGTFRIYDLDEHPRADHGPDAEFRLEDLADNVGTLDSIFDEQHSRLMLQQKLSMDAGVRVARLHNALMERYTEGGREETPQMHHDLAVLTVRLVFAMYAEDAGLFAANSFSKLVEAEDASHLRGRLIDLFHALNTRPGDRDPYLDDELKAFPYVNGGLYAERIEIPQLTDAIRDALLEASSGFDWSGISPVIFGSLMEETLSHDQRRQGGMHYTTVRNIHRVIDPLFLDGLTAELERIEHETVTDRTHKKHLQDYQDRLASLQFLDPACGSGNFLTETYLCLRRLENRVIAQLYKDDGMFDLGDALNPIKVSIGQFHGIEINDFAVSVARTALWIAEQQALDQTDTIVGGQPRLPLHDHGNIVCANALRYDWNELLSGSRCDYVMGNPPFIGQYLKGQDQTEDMRIVWGKNYDGYLDYATGWYCKASQYLTKPTAQFALVSTNSITQGVPVPSLFRPIVNDGWRIRFAHRTFGWDAQSTDMAHVHVVIIGMDKSDDTAAPPTLYTYRKLNGEPEPTHPRHINGYLLDGPDVYVEKRSQKTGPLGHGLNLANRGSQPTDGGNLILNTKEEYDEAMADPVAAKYVRPFKGSRELINGIDRWCLWLVDADSRDMRASSFLKERITACKEFREHSTKSGDAYKNRETPW